jgi:hypothetical protein
MVSVLYPGYRKPAMNGDAMSESIKLSHLWERKMEMEGLGPSGLGARLDGLAALLGPQKPRKPKLHARPKVQSRIWFSV